MTLDTFTDAFDILADAPGGIPRLRKLILQLAVQGRLVEQDPNDEPANTLFEQIQNKKLQLIKANRLRKSSPLPEVSFDEMFFDLPRSWMWVRLGELGDWGAGATPDRKRADFYSGTIRWLKSGELNDGYVADSEEKITELALAKCSLRVNAPGDILIAMYGATIGKLAILQIEATTNQAVCACTCFTGVYNRYLFYLLRAFRQRFTDQGAGGAQPNISREKIIHTVAPLPPLAEQRRIVERVDELMARCDTLEQQGAQQTTQRRRLLATLIDGLLHANDAHEAAIAWARLRDSFDMLLDTPELVAPLRQAVLQLAVQGRLVAQDERDEPASVLLERVRAEKARLVRECKIKKVEPSVLVIVGQHLFAVPKSWAWSTLQSLVQLRSNNSRVSLAT